MSAKVEIAVAELLDGAVNGVRLDPADGAVVFRDAGFHPLVLAAAKRRERLLPDQIVTYLVDRNINYTNICVTNCRFCGFYRPPGHAEGYILPAEVIAEKVAETAACGGTRILLQGGHHPDLGMGDYTAMLQGIHDRFPSLEIDAFSPSEIDHLAGIEKMSIEAVLTELMAAGMTGMPGGGAEILDDDVRRKVSPLKLSADGWIETMRTAQGLGLATSATMVIGLGETIEQRLNHLERLRRLQEESLASHGNGFTSFIAWTAEIDDNQLGRSRGAAELSATAHEYLRTMALARLYLDNFRHVSTSWPTLGAKIAEISLRMGADDFGSTMLEENVVSASGGTQTCMTEEAIRRHIRSAGFRPVKRDTRYNQFESTG